MDRMLRGKITRTDAQGVYVEVPKLGVGVEFGPCQVLRPALLDERTQDAGGHAHAVTAGDAAGVTDSAAAHAHDLQLGPAALQAEDEVLVTTVNGIKEDLVVLGRLT